MSVARKISNLGIIAVLAGAAITPPVQLQAQVSPATGPRLFLKIQLKLVKSAALTPGDVMEGTLVRGVYSGDRDLFPAASRVRLTIDKLERRRRTPNDHWPWIVKAFTPRYEKYPTFRSAMILLPDGSRVPLTVSLLSFGRQVEVRSVSKKTSQAADESSPPPGRRAKPISTSSTLIATLEATLAAGATLPAPLGSLAERSSQTISSQTISSTIPAGTEAKVVLLDDVSASRSRPGESFHARLVEPVVLDSIVVLPEGALLVGKVAKRSPPRILSRAGSLSLAFTELNPQTAAAMPVVATISGVELDRRSHTKVDPEGTLRGDHPGKAWMLVNAGAAGGMAKAADDGTQLVIEAIVSTATDASTAGVARIAATCVSGVFLITRHGRDVVLPKYTEMTITFDRPVTISVPPSKNW
jgi:hypothetical protein